MLGDLIHDALSSIGVTEQVVKDWLGVECGCEERRRKLNALTAWARRKEKDRKYLERIIDEDSISG